MVTPDDVVTASIVEHSPWHTITIERYRVAGTSELDYEVTHPAECDQLRYGQQCWFDEMFWEYDTPAAPSAVGVYRGRGWSEGPDEHGQFEGGREWEPAS